jgi:hypothetical protein
VLCTYTLVRAGSGFGVKPEGMRPTGWNDDDDTNGHARFERVRVVITT